jgi:hypothetical protein
MQVGLTEKRARFESLNSTGHEFVSQSSASPTKETLRQQLQELNTRWSDLPVLVEEKSAKVKTCKLPMLNSPVKIHLCNFSRRILGHSARADQRPAKLV